MEFFLTFKFIYFMNAIAAIFAFSLLSLLKSGWSHFGAKKHWLSKNEKITSKHKLLYRCIIIIEHLGQKKTVYWPIYFVCFYSVVSDRIQLYSRTIKPSIKPKKADIKKETKIVWSWKYESVIVNSIFCWFLCRWLRLKKRVSHKKNEFSSRQSKSSYNEMDLDIRSIF